MLSLLAQNIGDDERVILIEEVPEIFLDVPDVTRATYDPESVTDAAIGLPEVLDTALYGRYDRLIVGELHDEGAYRMLRVMATGADGSTCTPAPVTPSQPLEQVRNHVVLEYPEIANKVAADFIRRAINLVVVVERIDGEHRVKQIGEVEWRNLSDASTSMASMCCDA